MVENDNQMHTFRCNKCQKFKHVLKKVADKQQHGFACWTSIETRTRYSGCLIGWVMRAFFFVEIITGVRDI